MRMMKGEKNMKCLKIENGRGHYLDKERNYLEIDKMGKDDILFLLNIATDENETFEMDDPDESELSNPAHKIIYSNLYEKFSELLLNKSRFLDESEAIYKDALQKYQV